LFNRFVWRERGDVRDDTLSVVAPLGFLVLTAAYIAGTGLLAQFMTLAAPDLHWKTVFQTLRACFLPINESIFSHYVRHYRFLYALMGPLAGCLAVAMTRDAKLRAFVGLSIVWLALLLQPLFGHIDVRGTMYGSHLLYAASAPIACLLAAMLFSIPSLLPRWRGQASWLSVVAFCALLAFFIVHTGKQNSAYAAGGRALAKVQKSIKILNDRLHAPLILARDLPSSIAIMPAYSTAGMIVFDAPTGLLAAGTISGGRLKDELKQGHFTDVALRWDKDMQSLVPLDLGTTAQAPTTLSAGEIAQRMVPGIEFYKNARLDEQSRELVLESNTTTGPAIKLRAEGFSPLAPDFLCVEAKIDAPSTGIKPDIELYWTTREDPQYQNHIRRVTTPAFVSDNEYHRYYLPLRTIGWVTAGPADLLTLGFPAGARVLLRSISGVDKTSLMPLFSAVAKPATGTAFQPPFFRFPTEPGLGLIRVPLNADAIDISHSCENMEGASGVMIEISMPNKLFPNQNGADQSGVASSVMSIDGVKGTYGIPIAKFPVPGVYSLRAVAVNEKHHPIGNFSDDVYCLVTGKYRTGWSLQP